MNRQTVCTLIFLVSTTVFSQDQIVSKADTDHIFGLDRAGWEEYVELMRFPEGWRAQRMPLDTGTSIAAFDSVNGFGLGVQPLFGDSQGPPDMLIVSSWYLKDVVQFTDLQIAEMESQVQADLGTRYSVTARLSDGPMSPSFISVEFLISLTQDGG